MVEVKVEEEEVEEDEATNTAEGSAQAESKYGLKEGSLKERGKKSNKRPRKSSSEEVHSRRTLINPLCPKTVWLG